MEDQDKNYKTSDFCLASYLVAKNISITEVIRGISNRATFVFSSSEELTLLINEYYQMQAMIEPMAFFSAQKRIKQLIYQS